MIKENKTELQEAIDLMDAHPKTMVYQSTVIKAAQAYADLPEKIEGMKVDVPLAAYPDDDAERSYALSRNKALDDILNLSKDEV